MFCGNCGKKINADEVFCSRCGVRLTDENRVDKSNKCTRCGAKLDYDAKFCQNCGQIRDGSEEQQKTSQYSNAKTVTVEKNHQKGTAYKVWNGYVKVGMWIAVAISAIITIIVAASLSAIFPGRVAMLFLLEIGITVALWYMERTMGIPFFRKYFDYKYEGALDCWPHCYALAFSISIVVFLFTLA